MHGNSVKKTQTMVHSYRLYQVGFKVDEPDSGVL